MRSAKKLAIFEALSNRKSSVLNRSRLLVSEIKGSSVVVDGKAYLSFASNDYLGLSQDPELIRAYQNAVNLYGVGSVSSPLLCGHTKAHQKLEEALSEWTGFEKVLLFSSGYMANLALASFFSKGDHIFSDRHNHASLIEAIRLSSAKLEKLWRYPHLDIASLKKIMIRSESGIDNSVEKNSATNSDENIDKNNVCDDISIVDKTSSNFCKTNQRKITNKWLITEGIYSVDGDISPLPELEQMAREANCRLILDDSHGLGVLGQEGRGTLAHYSMNPASVDCMTASFSKAFGCSGAFLGGSEDMIDALIQFGRPYIYSTALSPALAECLQVSLRLVREQDWRREKLKFLIQYFQAGSEKLGLPILPSKTVVQTKTAIQILHIGNSEKLMLANEFLKKKGILAGALRPPTVGLGQDGFRITLSACHNVEDIDRLLLVLEEALNKDYI